MVIGIIAPVEDVAMCAHEIADEAAPLANDEEDGMIAESGLIDGEIWG